MQLGLVAFSSSSMRWLCASASFSLPTTLAYDEKWEGAPHVATPHSPSFPPTASPTTTTSSPPSLLQNISRTFFLLIYLQLLFCFVFFKNCYSVSKSVCRSIIFFRLFAVFKLLSSGFRRAPACHQRRLDLFLVTHSGSAKLSRNSFIYLFIPFRVVDVPIAVFKDETKTRGLSSLIIRAL